VQSLVFPIFDYASPVYNDLPDYLNVKIQRTQNACVRFVFGRVRRDEHITPYYIELKWLKLKERRLLSIAVLLFKILSKHSPSYLYSRFVPRNTVSLRTNRFTNLYFQMPNHNTDVYSKSFVCTAIRLYNNYDLQQFCDESTSIRLKKYLKERFLNVYV
jgi:hypothetical protein